MKMKFIKDGKTNRRQLVVAAQRGEELSTKQADRLEKNASALLLEFSHEQQRGSGLAMLRYDVEGLWSLRTYLAKRSLCVEELMGLLEAAQGVLDLCAAEHLRAEGLLFDPEYVFVDAQCCPHFALLPLDGAPFQTRNSPLALLKAIGDTDKLQFQTPDAEGLSRRLGELLIDLDGVFSANRFRRFIEQEQSLTQDEAPEARQSVVEEGTSSVWASAGGGGSSSTPDSGAFFWNPLDGLVEEEAPQEEPPKEPGEASWANVAETPVKPANIGGYPLNGQEVNVTAPSDGAVRGVSPNVGDELEVDGAAPNGGCSPHGQTVDAAAPNDGAAPNGGYSPHGQTVDAAAPVDVPMRGIPPVGRPDAPAPSNLWLVRLATGEQFLLPLNRQVMAGRGSACEIRLLNNRKLSRTHVALTSTGQMLMVTDQGAANGVFVGGQRLQSMQSVLLTPGQRLRLADEEFDVRIG